MSMAATREIIRLQKQLETARETIRSLQNALASESTTSVREIARVQELTNALREARPYVEWFPDSSGVSEEDEAEARETLRQVDAALEGR